MNPYLTESRAPEKAAGTAFRSAADELHEAVSVFVQVRPGLLRIAHRITGDAVEAEDVLQEAWMRWQGTDRTIVLNPSALLKTTTIRLAINVVQSTRRRLEACAGSWLPESPDSQAGPDTVAERQDAVERAVHLLMQTLTPSQRAVYVLREGFGYPYTRISEILHVSVANARQQASRAQERLARDRRPRPVDPAARRRLVRAFLTAARTGDLATLERELAAESTLGPAQEPLLCATGE
ncbi:sigma-70 family RNA polymerase sigma factor [Streptomyces sp. NPDC093984]|uniref:sigma-70 family RNA polymerase sigma factor n=1 Tax=Streptomyces sp. NPDC093984 TaxID=3366052 RepID=UPI003820AB9A